MAAYVARGEAELAVQQICEHMLVQGVDVVGPLPAELQKVTTFIAAVGADAAAPDPAHALIDLLLAPHVQAAMPAHGLEPARSHPDAVSGLVRPLASRSAPIQKPRDDRVHHMRMGDRRQMSALGEMFIPPIGTRLRKHLHDGA